MTKDKCLFEIWLDRKSQEKMSRNETKRLDILKAARNVFLESGFDLASMDEIAKRAGVSKRTVYSNFKSKEILFSGLMEQICLGKRCEVQLEIDRDQPVEEALKQLGYRFLKMIFEPEGTQLYRMMIANAPNFPEIGISFYNNGPEEVCEHTAEYLRDCVKGGKLQIDDPRMAAESFLSSCFGAQYTRCLIAPDTEPTDDMQKKMVNQAVSIFLHGTLKK